MNARVTPQVRFHLIADQLVGAADINFLINAVIAWALFRALPVVPLWGPQSIMVDTLWTAFLLPFLSCLIVIPLERRAVRKGLLQPVAWRNPGHVLLRWLPRPTFLRALVFGVLVVLLVPWPTWAVLSLLGVEGMSFWGFWAFKSLFATGLAALVVPVISLCALER